VGGDSLGDLRETQAGLLEGVVDQCLRHCVGRHLKKELCGVQRRSCVVFNRKSCVCSKEGAVWCPKKKLYGVQQKT
jgi:hypothetical protein